MIVVQPPRTKDKWKGRQEEDTGFASAARGQQEDNSRTRRGQHETTPGHRVQGAAKDCGQCLFSQEKTPTVNWLGNDVTPFPCFRSYVTKSQNDHEELACTRIRLVLKRWLKIPQIPKPRVTRSIGLLRSAHVSVSQTANVWPG